ncbi:MAG TPA: hypothetical protein VFP24_06160 [Gaiellaceae bacterium]|nr:hypothetical protein [Gaiellaceae bacterium]
MKLAALSFLAVLAALPLSAQAASSPTYAVTLQATVRDEVSYTQVTTMPEDCTINRTGSGGLSLELRSRARASVRKLRGRIAVRIGGTQLAGAFSELRRCRFLPPERLRGTCRATTFAPVTAHASFARVGRNRIAFIRGSDVPAPKTRLCGQDADRVLTPWPQRVIGSVNEAALRAGRARVVATGSVTRELTGTAANDPTVKLTEKILVRWRLVFTRSS